MQGQAKNLTGVAMDVDVIPAYQTLGLTYNWTCIFATTGTECLDVDANPLQLNATIELQYPGGTF
jgi:hypothetical protein